MDFSLILDYNSYHLLALVEDLQLYDLIFLLNNSF